MSKFIIKPGIYVVPDFGRIDCNKMVSESNQVKLYLNKHFRSFIAATPKSVSLLKKQKLSQQQIAQLIQRAKTPEEVNWLLEVKNTKLLKTLADVKIKTFE